MKYVFPQYRKLANDLSYYEIVSADFLKEIQRMGNRWTEYEIKAKILPERLLIEDVLNNEGERYDTITKHEFDDFKNFCLSNLKKF